MNLLLLGIDICYLLFLIKPPLFITKNEYNEATNDCHGPMILNVT